MEHDVVIVGGSLAGCATATLLGRQGARVALIERAAALDHYKVCCTHYVHPPGAAVLERLGVADAVDADRDVGNVHTRYGWVRPPRAPGGPPLPLGFDVRRSELDPAVRARAIDTPGVEYMAGKAVTALLRDGDGRPCGVVAGGQGVRGRLVVAADGRGSTMARLAGIPGRVRPNQRFGYFAYFEGLPPEARRTRMWLRDPDMGYTFPSGGGLTLCAAMPHKRRLEEFKADVDGAMKRFFDALPDAPDLRQATRVGKWIGRMDMTNVRRPAAAPGIAFVGDAAQASDPVWGVGCGFALVSAEMLAAELGMALTSGGDVDVALERYRRRHRRALAGHHFLTSDYSSGRGLNPLEKVLFRGATADPEVARRLYELAGRGRPVRQTLTPGLMARATRAVARGRRPVAA